MYKMARSGVGALILAAGLSSRMQPILHGGSKALFPLGGVSMLEHCYALFTRAGIENITVVTGHDSESVAPLAMALGAHTVHNGNYTDGMFGSITCGLQSLAHSACAGVFLLPVDMALVRLAVVKSMLQSWNVLGKGQKEYIYVPAINGAWGHPPLIGRGHWDAIASWSGEGGLQGYMLRSMKVGGGGREALRIVPVEDEGILRDIDTPDDARLASEYIEKGRLE